jgi:ABC-2 type transport system permease protein
MQRVLTIVRKELRQIFRDPRTKRVVFAAPIIQLVLFGYAVTTDVHDVATFVVDHDRTVASRELQDVFTSSGHFQIVASSERPADLATALDAGHAVIGLEIPAGFARDLAAGRGASVQVLVDGTHSNTATVAQGHAARIIQQYGASNAAERAVGTAAGAMPAGGEGAGFGAGPGAAAGGGVELRARAWFNPDLESRVYNVPAILGVLLLLMCLLLTALTVVRERELGTLEQLMVSPLTPGELMLGKTIPVAIIALADLAIIAVVAVAWFDVPFRGSISALVLASLLHILASLGLGLFISTVSKTQQEAFMGMFLVMLPAIILSGFMYPVHTMPELFQYLSLANPLRHYLVMVRGIFLKGHGIVDLWAEFLVVGVMAAVVLAGATARFRRSMA